MNADRPDSRPEDPDHGLDIDAAFAEIVANWGPQPDDPERIATDADPREPEGPVDATPKGCADADPDPGPDPDALADLFRPVWRPPEPPPVPPEPTQEPFQIGASWDEDGHFVPPPPPPLPPVDPRRKIAWAGLVGSPAVAVLLAVLDVVVPSWVAVFLMAAFVGGFGYLVATMRSSPPDDWSGDDGAVV
jgi:hypothetical protein